MQTNAISKLEYTGFNQNALQTVKTEKSYQSSEWMTFVQAKQIGRSVRKGEKGVCLVRVVEVQKRNKKGKVEDKTYLKRFTVFNFEQTDVTQRPDCDRCAGWKGVSNRCQDCGKLN